MGNILIGTIGDRKYERDLGMFYTSWQLEAAKESVYEKVGKHKRIKFEVVFR